MSSNLFLAILTLISVQGGAEGNASGLAAASQQEAAQGRVRHLEAAVGKPVAVKVRFVLDFPTESDVVYRIVNDRTIVQKGKEKQPFRTTAAYTLRIKHLREKSEYIDLLVSIERLEWSVQGTPTDKKLDTESKDASESNKDLAFLRSLIGTSYIAVLDARGNLFALKSGETTRNDQAGAATLKPPVTQDDKTPKSRFATPVQAPRAAENREMAEWRELVGEHQLRNLFRSMYAWIPTSPIEVRGRWQREDRQPAGAMLITRRNFLTLESMDRGVAKVQSRIDVSSSSRPSEGAMDLPATRIKQTTPGAATIFFDNESHLITSLEAQVEFELHAENAAKTMFGKSVDVDQLLAAKTTVQLLAPAAIAAKRDAEKIRSATGN